MKQLISRLNVNIGRVRGSVSGLSRPCLCLVKRSVPQFTKNCCKRKAMLSHLVAFCLWFCRIASEVCDWSKTVRFYRVYWCFRFQRRRTKCTTMWIDEGSNLNDCSVQSCSEMRGSKAFALKIDGSDIISKLSFIIEPSWVTALSTFLKALKGRCMFAHLCLVKKRC